MKKYLNKYILAILSILMLFGIWYSWKYSMGIVATYEINSPSADNSLLLATQGSKYKNKVTQSIVENLSSENVYIKVVDIHNLENENPEDYTATVLIHTIEMWKAPKYAVDFVKRTDQSKLMVIATSGDGSYHIEGVDGITSASPVLDSEKHANQIVLWYKRNFLP